MEYKIGEVLRSVGVEWNDGWGDGVFDSVCSFKEGKRNCLTFFTGVKPYPTAASIVLAERRTAYDTVWDVRDDQLIVFIDNAKLTFIKIVEKYFPLTKELNVVLGKNVIIKYGAVIGYDGFEFYEEEGVLKNFPHRGRVILEDDVQIGCNCCIDRGSLGDTIIGKGTKLDNLVHVAHNVKIGKNCQLTAGVILGGSVEIGDNVFIGLNATIKDNIKIGSNSIIGMGAVVIHDVPEGVTVVGNPARILEKHDFNKHLKEMSEKGETPFTC